MNWDMLQWSVPSDFGLLASCFVFSFFTSKPFSFLFPTNIIAIVLEGSAVWVKVIDFQKEMEKRQRCRKLYMSVRSNHLWKHRGISICRRTNRRSITATPLHCREQFTWYPTLDSFFFFHMIVIVLSFIT